MILGLLSAAVRAMSLPYRLRTRLRIMAGYTRLRLKLALGMRPSSERFLGMTLHFADYGGLVFLVEEIFVSGQYVLEDAFVPERIVDGGSNIGLSVLFCRWRYPQARIEAFEADPETAAILRRNIAANHIEGVTVHAVALSDRDGMATFRRGDTGPGSLDSHLAESPDTSGSFAVPTARLSTFVDSTVDLLKLDVEGAEALCLSELQAAGRFSLVRRMIVESHHQPGGESTLARVIEHFERNGWSFRVTTPADSGVWSSLRQDVLVYAKAPPGAPQT